MHMARSLEETPTWALATVCFVIISTSLVIEYLIHTLSHWLRKHKKNALFEAVEKLKSGLMILGFVSLSLTVSERTISGICIPKNVASTMLPCRGRILAAESDSESSDYCTSEGKTSLMSESGVNQLSIFIFVLAVMQVAYSVLTMALGRAKMRRWKRWEEETRTVEYLAANDPNRFRLTRQTTFGKRHTNWGTSNLVLLWIKCFFRQFFDSVAKVDYLTLRHGFIAAHLSNNNSFNFQKYIERSLEDDFKLVVGIRPLMWLIAVIFLLADVYGSHVYLWVSFIPLIIVLVLGTKLVVIVAKMALRLQSLNNVIKGAPLVQPNDNLFWFNDPKFVLTLLHYTLFVNAFELAFFVWVTLLYGIKSCYHESIEIVIVRVALAITVQVMCSYITLPLYALVTQMGSQYKSAVLEEQTLKIIRHWLDEVKKKRKNQDNSLSNRFHPPSPLSTGNRTIGPPDFSTDRRVPTLAQVTFCPSTSTNEIVDDGIEDGISSIVVNEDVGHWVRR